MTGKRPAPLACLLLLTLPAFAQTPPEPSPSPAAPATAPPSTAASLEANRAVVRRYIEEVLSAGDWKALDQLVAPTYVDSSPGAGDDDARGPQRVRTAQELARKLFRDIHYRIDHLVAEGEEVVARYTVHAVRQATPDDAPDAGREIGVVGMTIFRLAGGRIAESWTINDQMEMFRQLGYTLEPPKPQKPPPPVKPGG
ncbi:MAG TPA: ester cyclase [Thermoanaerobaculia bacterium]|nr:ester cyclase [Thermoanaerobaculia bacterium]